MRIGIETITLQSNLPSLINFISFDKNDKFLWKKENAMLNVTAISQKFLMLEMT